MVLLVTSLFPLMIVRLPLPSEKFLKQYCFHSTILGGFCTFKEVQLPYHFKLLLEGEVRSYFEIGPSDST